MVDLRGRDFLKLLDYTPEEIRHLIDVAIELKNLKKNTCNSLFEIEYFLNNFNSFLQYLKLFKFFKNK